TWRIDPKGELGVRRWYESKEKPGTPITIDEYFADIFDHKVPGLPETARSHGLTPLQYMRRFGAYEVPYKGQERYAAPAADGAGIEVADGDRRVGFPTPSKRLELHSPTLTEWGFGEHALPGYVRSQVHWSHLDLARGERALLP